MIKWWNTTGIKSGIVREKQGVSQKKKREKQGVVSGNRKPMVWAVIYHKTSNGKRETACKILRCSVKRRKKCYSGVELTECHIAIAKSGTCCLVIYGGGCICRGI